MERGEAGKLRFTGAGPCLRNLGYILDAVGAGARGNGGKLVHLILAGCDDELAAAPVREAVRIEIGMEAVAARHAEAGAQASFGIVDSGVNDLAVARGGGGSDRSLAFENDDLAA